MPDDKTKVGEADRSRAGSRSRAERSPRGGGRPRGRRRRVQDLSGAAP